MPGSLTTPGRRALALTRPFVWPSVTVTTSAPGTIALSRLNGRPARSPADASPGPSRGPTHGSGPVWLARPSLQRTFTSYSLPVSRRTTVGEVGSSGGEAGEAGGTGGGARGSPEPGREPLEVDRGRGGHVLQVGLGQPPVAAAAQAEGADALRDGALDPGPSGVAAPALPRREPAPGGLERLVLRPRLQLQVPGPVLGPGAQGSRRAGAAVGLAERHRDVGRAGVVDLPAPG